MTSSLIDLAISNKVEKFGFASSVYVYSGLNKIPFNENNLTIPGEALGASKISAESLLKMKAMEGCFQSIAYRIFTAYGPRCRGHQFIPQAIKKIKNKNSVVEFGSPRIKRDFIYIDDLAEAIVATLKTSKAWDIFQPLNIGSGRATPISELIDIIAELVETKKEIRYVDTPLGMADLDHCANIDKIKKLTNWKPKTNLRKGLKQTIKNYT